MEDLKNPGYRFTTTKTMVTNVELRQMAMRWIKRWAVLHENAALAQLESFPEQQREEMIAA